MKKKNVQETPKELTQTLSFVWHNKYSQICSNLIKGGLISIFQPNNKNEFVDDELNYASAIREYLKNRLTRSIIGFISLNSGNVKYCKCVPFNGINKEIITHFKTVIGNQEFTVIVLDEGDHEILKNQNCKLPMNNHVFVADNLERFKYWYCMQLKLSELKHKPIDTCLAKKICGKTLGELVNPYLHKNIIVNIEGGLRDETN